MSSAGSIEQREDGFTYFRGRYVHLSRGKHHAKHLETGTWARQPMDSTEDVLVLDRPGKWMVHSNDGFNRRKTDYIVVATPATSTTERNKLTLELTLTVEYDLNGEDPQLAKERLEDMVRVAVGEGLLTGDSPMEMDEWRVRVREIESN